MTDLTAMRATFERYITAKYGDQRLTKDEHGDYSPEILGRFQAFQAAWNAKPAAQVSEAVALTVWEGAMPESNGKSNFTAILNRKDAKGLDVFDGFTIARSEYPDRVRYEADCVRHLIGELSEKPCILDYDADKHSGYTHPATEQADVPTSDGRDAERYRWLKKHAQRIDFDGGNSGVWEIRGVAAYDNWVGNKFNHRTFDKAVDAAMKKDTQ